MAESIIKTSPHKEKFPKRWAVGSTTPGPYTDNTVHTLYTDTFSGVKNPGWKEQVRSVSDATTPAAGVRTTVSSTAASGFAEYWSHASSTNPVYRHRIWLDRYINNPDALASMPALGTPSETTATNRAIAKLQNAIIGFESTAQAGEDLGEIRQTVNMLKDPMRKLRGLTTRLIEGHQKALTKYTLRDTVGALADTTLEYRFGIKPLINTFANGLVGLQNRDHLAHYYPFSVTGKDETAVTWTEDPSFTGVVLVLRHDCRRSRTRRVRYKGVWGVKAGLNQRAVRDVLGLRFRDVVPTIWNLIPYSFLADYCANIGDIAESISVDWTGVRWCCKTVLNDDLIVKKQSRAFFASSPQYRVNIGVSSSSCEKLVRTFTRVKQIEQPRPKLEIDFQLGGMRLVNIAALIASKAVGLTYATKKAEERWPDLGKAFASEMGRRGTRIPYPFH